MKKVVFLSAIFVFLFSALHAQNDSSVYRVSLSSLEGGITNNYVRMKWKTVCYLSFATFQIQRSVDGVLFSTINSFVADRLRCRLPFEFVDSSSTTSAPVFYRINVGDIDGNFYHSKIIKVLNRLRDSQVLSVYPTVVNSTANIVLSSPIDDNIRMRLISSAGIIVKQYYYKVSKGVTNFSLNLSDIAKGSYWITAVQARGTQHVVAVIKQ